MTEKKSNLIILFFMLFVKASQAQLITDLVNPTFWKAISECKLCDPKQSTYIQQKKSACQWDLKIYECQGLAKKYPELKENLKTCDEKQICEETLFKNSLESFGCVTGFGENIYDFVSIIGDLAKTSPQKNLRQMCLNLPECSKELLAFEKNYQASLKKAKEQKLNSFQDFYQQSNNPEFAKITTLSTALIKQNIFKKYFPEEFKGHSFPTRLEINKFIEEIADKQFRSYDCFNTKSQAQLMCYWFFSVVDPFVALKLLKVDKGLAKFVQIVFKDRRAQSVIESEEELKYFRPLEEKVTRSPQRQAFVDKYLHLQTSTYQERLEFMKLVDAPKSKNRIFIDFENSQLKYLNDSLKDKDFITSVDNYAIKLISEKVQKLAVENKIPLKVSRLSDGKGVSLALEGPIDARITQELSRISSETNKEIQKLLIDSKLVRESDEPEKWFKTGIGETIDEANLASRFSRGAAGENRAYHFADPAVQENLGHIYEYAKNFSQDLGKEPSLNRFMQTIQTANGPVKIPNLEFFENLRKYPTPEKLRNAIRLKYDGLEISENLATKALDYAKIVDDLNPKILVADQSVVTFRTTQSGGMVMDRKGMGAMNQESTAMAIAKSQNFGIFPTVNRMEEKTVTEKIDKERKQLKELIDADSRGDDTVKDKTYTLEEKRSLLKSDVAANRRTVFVPENTPDLATKQQLGTHGEGLEKILTDDVLLGKIPFEKQKQIRFGIDMRTTQLGDGQVDLLIQPMNGTTLTPSERKIIQDSFNEAVKAFNEKQRSLNHPTNYFYRNP